MCTDLAIVSHLLQFKGMDNEMQVYSQWKASSTLMHRSTSFYPHLAALGSDGASRDAELEDEDEEKYRRFDDASLSRLGPQLTPGGVLKASPSLLKLNASIRYVGFGSILSNLLKQSSLFKT